MWLFKTRRQPEKEATKHAQHAAVETVKAKQHTARSINKVDAKNDRLLSLLKADGITLLIHVATRENHKHAR